MEITRFKTFTRKYYDTTPFRICSLYSIGMGVSVNTAQCGGINVLRTREIAVRQRGYRSLRRTQQILSLVNSV